MSELENQINAVEAPVVQAASLVRSITIDTLTAVQENQFMEDQNKPGHDEWKDYGTDIYKFILNLQRMGFEIIMILGEPGTGKSSGMRTLIPNSNIWFNADDKNPVWKGGTQEYGKKLAPRFPFHQIPKSYTEILDFLQQGINNNRFEEQRYAFVIGHTETYKVGPHTKERLKTLGKLATKMQLEGKMETVMYSRVVMTAGKPKFVLETLNDGSNTARSHQDMFPGRIDNDYQLIIEKLLEF